VQRKRKDLPMAARSSPSSSGAAARPSVGSWWWWWLLLVLVAPGGSLQGPCPSSPAVPGDAAVLRALIEEGVSHGEPVSLGGRCLSVSEPIKLPSPGSFLHLRGPGTLRSTAHSIFQVGGNRQQLVLEGLDLVHETCGDRREVGAALFVLGKSAVTVRNCSLTSHQGFGIWVVQRGRVDLVGSRVERCGRSGAVCFGDAKLSLHECVVRESGIHGVCARGRSSITLASSTILASGNRGVFAYHNVTCELHECLIANTRSSDLAGLQVEALRPEDHCVLRLRGTTSFRGNGGLDVLLRGKVSLESLPLPVDGGHDGDDDREVKTVLAAPPAEWTSENGPRVRLELTT